MCYNYFTNNSKQQEETPLMQNVVYNELCLRGYLVDVGGVEINERQANSKYVRKQTEVDFVCNKVDERVYVQSAFSIPTTEKRLQEKRPQQNAGDGFRKVVVTKDNMLRYHDENGILIMSLQDFWPNMQMGGYLSVMLCNIFLNQSDSPIFCYD